MQFFLFYFRAFRAHCPVVPIPFSDMKGCALKTQKDATPGVIGSSINYLKYIVFFLICQVFLLMCRFFAPVSHFSVLKYHSNFCPRVIHSYFIYLFLYCYQLSVLISNVLAFNLDSLYLYFHKILPTYPRSSTSDNHLYLYYLNQSCSLDPKCEFHTR